MSIERILASLLLVPLLGLAAWTATMDPPGRMVKLQVWVTGDVVSVGDYFVTMKESDLARDVFLWKRNMQLDLSQVIDSGEIACSEICFPEGSCTGTFRVRQIKKQDPIAADSDLNFFARRCDGTVGKYNFTMFGVIDDPSLWLPQDLDEIGTVTLLTWKLDPFKKWRKNACDGSDAFPEGVTVHVKRVE